MGNDRFVQLKPAQASQKNGGSLMELPHSVRRCIDALESAGFEAYAVGGCVRDHLLGLTPHDYDLCTSALPHETQAVFPAENLVLAGVKHGTVGVVTEDGVVEITTYRTEGGYADSRHPDWVRFVPELREDLARRDFTVNAMAYSPTRGYADPFGGQADLEKGILRAVGDPRLRFSEDALRILRGVRFAVRFRLNPDSATEKAMAELAPTLDKLARERVFDELCKLLQLVNAADLLRFSPILAAAIPELGPMIGFDQHSPHHAFDVFTHTAYVCGNVPPELPLRWAALLHDVGKPGCFTQDSTGRGHFYGHAQVGAEIADGILRRLKAPTALRERVTFLIRHHMTPLTPDRKLLKRRLSQFGDEAVFQILALQRGDFGSKGVLGEAADFDEIENLLHEILAENACLQIKDLKIGGKDLMALGIPAGPIIGKCLNHLLEQVLDDQLPNEPQALLTAAAHFL
jgi:tRNA nucleotidyltransferase (CCA-adding enzyme)